MKKLIMLFVAIVMMAGFSTTVMAQLTDDATNDANAQILGAIAVTAVNPLEFGGMTSALIGTAVMTPGGGLSATGGVTLLVGGVITPTPASYTVSGTGLTQYTIHIPVDGDSKVITNTTGIGAETMTLTSWTCSKGAVTAGDVNSTFLANGTDSFSVGATLSVAAAQAPGVYEGTFNVTVAY